MNNLGALETGPSMRTSFVIGVLVGPPCTERRALLLPCSERSLHGAVDIKNMQPSWLLGTHSILNPDILFKMQKKSMGGAWSVIEIGKPIGLVTIPVRKTASSWDFDL